MALRHRSLQWRQVWSKIDQTMTFLSSLLSLVLFATSHSARAEDVSQCFVVHEMVKSEDLRYFVDAVSKCSREYDAVYVMVSFLDAKGSHLDDGVWAIYWCRPGRRAMRFRRPGSTSFPSPR